MAESTETMIDKSLEFIKSKDFKSAEKILLPLADIGNPEAQSILSYIYSCKIPESDLSDYAKSKEYARESSLQNYGYGQYNFGIILWEEDNIKKAFELFERSCNQEVGYSCLNLGYFYHQGIFVEKDFLSAQISIGNAALKGYFLAIRIYSELKQDCPFEIDISSYQKQLFIPKVDRLFLNNRGVQ